MQSGHETSMVHRRAGVRKYQKFDPVYFCFCNMAQFKQYKLGFDRMFHIGKINKQSADVQEAAIAAQQAAIAAIKPGVLAEDVAQAAITKSIKPGATKAGIALVVQSVLPILKHPN